jgi:hypothetical protein
VIFYEDSKMAEKVLKRQETVENGKKTLLPKKVTPSELESLRNKGELKILYYYFIFGLNLKSNLDSK